MSAALLDVNVLIALFDPAHPHHDRAHAWFGPAKKKAWATCPMTINGCVRVLSQPAYPSFTVTPGEVVSALRELCESPAHEFWGDDVSLLDSTLFRPTQLEGAKKITDAYLLGLAVKREGFLVTFDRTIPLRVVVGASRNHLRVLD
ncbi:MAG: TA system VapC family ribonuclease toxin [Bryobacteraceae bacterium]